MSQVKSKYENPNHTQDRITASVSSIGVVHDSLPIGTVLRIELVDTVAEGTVCDRRIHYSSLLSYVPPSNRRACSLGGIMDFFSGFTRILLIGLTVAIIFAGCTLAPNRPSTSREANVLMNRARDLVGRINADVVSAFDAFQQAERIAARAEGPDAEIIAEQCFSEALDAYRVTSEAANFAEGAIASYRRYTFGTTERLASARQIYADVAFARKVSQEHAEWAEKHSKCVFSYPEDLGKKPIPLSL